MKRSIFQIVGLLLLLPLFSGCNDSDDLQGIFTGKTWKLTYINLKDKGGWMNGFSEKSIKILNENQESYTITFTGTEEDNRISNGAVKGELSLQILRAPGVLMERIMNFMLALPMSMRMMI